MIKKSKLAPVEFIKQNKGDLRDLKKNIDTISMFGVILAKISILGGFKDSIDNLNREDILDLVALKFKELSMDEIYYAFQLERFGMLDVQIEHFQLFNSIYVGRVLFKYKKYKAEKIRIHSIKKQEMEKQKKPSEEETKKLENKHITESLLHYQSTGKILFPYLYLVLYNRNELPEHTSEFKKQIRETAIDYLKRQRSNPTNKIELRTLTNKINGKESITSVVKEIVLKQYFKSKTNINKQPQSVKLKI